MPKKPDDLVDGLIDALEVAQRALTEAPAKEGIIDERYWTWHKGPRATALETLKRALG